jgi:hypothetical protein
MRRRITDRGGLVALQNYFSKFQIADKDADLDRDGYTCGSPWDGTFQWSNGATGTINWVTAFGLPEKPKFVNLFVSVHDAGSAGANYNIGFKAKNTTTNYSAYADAEAGVSGVWRDHNLWTPVADDGTTYYAIVASGVNTMRITIRLNAWIR